MHFMHALILSTVYSSLTPLRGGAVLLLLQHASMLGRRSLTAVPLLLAIACGSGVSGVHAAATTAADANTTPSATTTLTVLATHGATTQALFGVNWEGVVFGWSFRNHTCGQPGGVCTLSTWVNKTDPLLSPKIVNALRALRVRSVRFPGGSPSNSYNWQNASFVPPDKCNPLLPAHSCDSYWNSQTTANRLFGEQRRGLSWQRFAALLDELGIDGVWSLDVVNQSPTETADILKQLQTALAHKPKLVVELGNEIYAPPIGDPQPNGPPQVLFPTAAAYIDHVKLSLAARLPRTQLSVTVPPCPAFYSEACWGGPTTWLATFYSNMSAACGAGEASSSCPWQQVTAHHYRPRVSVMDCTPYDNCTYRRQLQADGAETGLIAELEAQGGVTNSTFAAAMIAYPSVSVGAAVASWQRDFPGLKLLISEFNADEASSWDTTGTELGEGGAWLRDNADAGSHALHWASGVLAGVNSNGTVSGINYHSFEGGGHSATKNKGFGCVDFSSPDDTVWFNPVAQLMSHLSALVADTNMHAVLPGDAKLQLTDLPAGLIIDSQKQLPALQSAAFSDDKSGGLVLVAINRGGTAIDVVVDLGDSGVCSRVPTAGLVAVVTQYDALDPGGWVEMDPVVAAKEIVWSGPMKPSVSRLVLRRGLSSTSLRGLAAPPLSLIVVQIDAC